MDGVDVVRLRRGSGTEDFSQAPWSESQPRAEVLTN
jgi:hypothetical protein